MIPRSYIDLLPAEVIIKSIENITDYKDIMEKYSYFSSQKRKDVLKILESDYFWDKKILQFKYAKKYKEHEPKYHRDQDPDIIEFYLHLGKCVSQKEYRYVKAMLRLCKDKYHSRDIRHFNYEGTNPYLNTAILKVLEDNDMIMFEILLSHIPEYVLEAREGRRVAIEYIMDKSHLEAFKMTLKYITPYTRYVLNYSVGKMNGWVKNLRPEILSYLFTLPENLDSLINVNSKANKPDEPEYIVASICYEIFNTEKRKGYIIKELLKAQSFTFFPTPAHEFIHILYSNYEDLRGDLENIIIKNKYNLIKTKDDVEAFLFDYGESSEELRNVLLSLKLAYELS